MRVFGWLLADPAPLLGLLLFLGLRVRLLENGLVADYLPL